MSSFEYCEIFKNTCFEEHLETAASVAGEGVKNTLSSTLWRTLLYLGLYTE